MPLTVGRLREVIADLDDDVVVGVSGWYGELHPFSFAPDVKNVPLKDTAGSPSEDYLVFDYVDIGPEPE